MVDSAYPRSLPQHGALVVLYHKEYLKDPSRYVEIKKQTGRDAHYELVLTPEKHEAMKYELPVFVEKGIRMRFRARRRWRTIAHIRRPGAAVQGYDKREGVREGWLFGLEQMAEGERSAHVKPIPVESSRTRKRRIRCRNCCRRTLTRVF